MNWTEQAESMVKTWSETQKKAWEGWYDLARSGPGMSGTSLFSNMSDPMQMFKQGIEAWTAGSGSTARDMAGQLFNGQRAMMQTLELLTQSWQIVSKNLDTGKDWHGDVQQNTQQWGERVLGVPSQMFETTANTQELWQSFMGEWGPLLKPWLTSVNQMASGHLGEGLMGSSSGMSKLFNLEMDGLTRLFDFEAAKNTAFNKMAQIPSVGFTREQNTKLLRAFDAFVDLRKAHAKYRTSLSTAMADAVKRTMEKLADMAKEGKSINSVRELNKLWLDVADQVFTEMLASDEHIQLQNEVSGAGLKYRIEMQKVTEMFLKNFNLPTRSELDDTYRTLYQLRKEVKTLKKTVAELTQPSPKLVEVVPGKKTKAATRKATTSRKAAQASASPAK
jgi:class III poly(R)-hydroxyalkanoic acid synthase PhaE subunit